MDFVGKVFDTIGELDGVRDQIPALVSAFGPAIINYDMVISQISESVFYHRLRSAQDQRFINIALKGIPRKSQCTLRSSGCRETYQVLKPICGTKLRPL
jgi:hypothetical protein